MVLVTKSVVQPVMLCFRCDHIVFSSHASRINSVRIHTKCVTGILMAQLRTLASVGKGESEQAARTYDRLARLCLFQNDEKMTLEYTSRLFFCCSLLMSTAWAILSVHLII